ncbi:uncharacterized protein LOC135949198 [Calliphora vicina]|uniref:uncharacterized protein LOC135949198 n=1 Tax=Calliphora vicina TaxID=7373 RepID=UPI00325B8A5D
MVHTIKSNHTFGKKLANPIVVLLIIQILFIGSSSAIKCFKCAVTVEKIYSYAKNATIITPMCSKFDESDEYIVDCPYSTMCLKTISTLHLQNGQQQETFTRGCAPQKDTKQVFNNGRWHQEHSVQEVYEEGCGDIKENTIAASLKTLCYCRGNLCNSSKQILLSVNTMTVIALTSALLYL